MPIPLGFKFSSKKDTLGFGRRTVKKMKMIDYLSPEMLINLLNTKSWSYKVGNKYLSTTVEKYKMRDRALICCAYLMALRISEVLRLKKSNFKRAEHPFTQEEYIYVGDIQLSKRKVLGRPRKYQEREGMLTLSGERKPLTEMINSYLLYLKDDEKLFPFKPQRAWQIITTITGYPPHFFRAFGEDYLYEGWGKDPVAVADYIKVDIRTFAHYIHSRTGRRGPV